jgi:hypothetical protein
VRLRIVLLAVLPVLCPALARAEIMIVNVIPNNLSNETAQNSEPSIAVNPMNANQVIISAFGTGLTPGNPYFQSQNGGMTWTNFQNIPHGDTTLDWSASGNAYLARLNGTFDVQRSLPPNNPPSFSIIPGSAQSSADQPWVKVAQVGGQDRIYVSYNSTAASPFRANIRYSTNGGATWTNEMIERTALPLVQDAPPTRIAINGDRVYVAFQRWTSANGADWNGNVAIVRDDHGGTLPNPFRDLGATGVQVVSNIVLPGPLAPAPPNGTTLGQERIRSSLSVAVDPHNADKVLVAYTEVPGAPTQRVADMRVRLSRDGGQTWTQVFDANYAGGATALPTLAIADNGTIGLLYERLFNNRLETHLVQTTDDFATFTDTLLFSFTNNAFPVANPYVGDYFDMQAVGDLFLGTFTASNNLNDVIDPLGVTFQRNFDFGGPGGTFRLRNTTDTATVPFSLDPYFFRATVLGASALPEPSTFTLLGFATVGLLGYTWRRRQAV